MVKVWADFVPVTDAVLLSVVLFGAVTCPRIVTVAASHPFIDPMLHVTRFPLGPPWVHSPSCS